jgi:ABC-type multidrug transport system fused ATPase/permease subunit
VRPGERVSLAGASERQTAGLVDAIFGLNPLTAGIVEVDGHDVRDLSLPELRRRVAVVRDAEIFPGCVLDNLRAGNPDLSSEEAWDALGRVGLAETLKRLPDGLRTPLLRDGAPLSRSQTVALAIARALAGKPSILVLDRSLDRLGPREAARIANCVSSAHDVSVVLVSDDPAVHQAAKRHIDFSSLVRREGEAA